MSLMNPRIGCLVALLISSLSLSAYGTIVAPTNVVASSALLTGANRQPAFTIDGVGLNTTPTVANVLTVKHDEAAEEGIGSGDGLNHGGMWLTDNGGITTGVITFDLGSVMTIDKLYVWNYAEVAFANTAPMDFTDRGARNVDIYVTNSLNASGVGGDTFIQAFTGSDEFDKAAPSPLASTNVVNTTGASWNADYNTAVELKTFTTPFTGRYIKFNITSNWGGSHLGLSEVRFNAIPEPSATILLVLGSLSLIRGARNRRCD